MVTYEYESKFKNHTSVTWIVISHGGTFSWDSTDHEYKSTASDFFLQDADFVSESVILDEKLCSEDNLKFGLCEAAYFSIQIKNITDVPNLKDEMIDVYFYFDNDPDTLFRVGTYKVDTDKYSADRQLRTLDCYDLLYYLWDYDITEWYYGSKSVQSVYSDGQAHTMSDLITDLFDYLQDEGVEISLKANQTLINGTYTIPKNIETDTLTFGFWIQPVLEANAAFGNINRDGEFEWIVLEWYDKAPKRVLNDYSRRPPTPYEDKATWGIGQIDVYNRDNDKIFTYRNSSKKRPSKYSIVDSFVFDSREPDDANVMTLLTNMHDAIWHTNYRTYEAQTYGDLCLEVGDRIDVYFDTDEPTEHRIRSYVLERHFTGLNALRDSYSARGDLKQPNYSVNGNWHSGDSASGNSGNSGAYELDTEQDRHLIQVLRNGGYRFLDEPSDVVTYYDSANMQMKFKWTDPDDISDYKPLPCEWVGTVIIRKENERPLHRWDGELIVRSTTRDEYSEDWYVDDTIEANKKYYYAIMPYYIALDDNDHPIRHYTWTKVISVNTEKYLMAATIIYAVSLERTEVEITYYLPEISDGSYTSVKIAAKKDAIPSSLSNADNVYDITNNFVDPILHRGQYTVSGLDEGSHYYFVIFSEDTNGNKASSEEQDCYTEPSPVPPEYKTYVDKLASYYISTDNARNSLLECQDYTGNSNTVSLAGYSMCIAGNFNTTGNQYDFYLLSACTITVTTNADSINVNYSCTVAPHDSIVFNGRSMWGAYTHSGNHVEYLPLGIWRPVTAMSWYGDYNKDTVDINFTTTFESMVDCLSYLTQHFRRCNLIVDGVTWLDVS